MRLKHLIAGLGACALLLLPACGDDSADDGGGADGGGVTESLPDPEPDNEPTPNPEPDGEPPDTGGPVELSATAGCVVTGDLEGQFTSSDQMDDYLECLLPGVVEWVNYTYSDMSFPAVYFVPAGVSGRQPCPYDERDLMHCNADHGVYFGEAAVWQQYTEFGDAAAAVILAHEVTHHFQRVVGGGATSLRDSIRYEDQADCGAGAFMRYAADQGWMNVEDDIYDLAGSLADAGAAEGPDRDHGTIDERLESFDIGWLSELDYPLYDCVDFVPEFPIIT